MLTNLSRTSLALGIVLANALALVIPATASETALRNNLAAGSTLTVRTITGFIHVTRGYGEATVTAVSYPGGHGGPPDVHVAQSRSAGSWTLCEAPLTVNSCDGEIDRDNTHGHVDFTITVPAGVKLHLTTVTADVAVTGATSDVTAESVSGDVRIVTSGSASAKTVSGSQNVHMGIPRDSASFDSVSGAVALSVPRATNAEVSVDTLSGSVTGGGIVHFTGDRNFVGHNVHATIGHGGTPVDIHTVSGSIDVTTI